MVEQNQPGTGASGDNSAQAPKLEIKEGKPFIDGHAYVKESDLIASKKSLEQQLAEAQKVHNEAYDKARLELSAAQQQVAATSAKLKELETQARQSGASGSESATELVKAKQDLEAAKTELKNLQEGSVAYRKKYLQAVGGVSEEQLKDMSVADLDGLEKALAILGKNNSRGGPGNYMTLGGVAGGGTQPISELDRAKALLAKTPIAGVRNQQN